MEVELLEATDNAEEIVCRAARNDYMSDYGAELSFEEVMDTVTGNTIEEKQHTLLRHLMKHGHFGPFEHAQATFHVKGISRACMAQITRHRHASFDVQSMRYVKMDNAEVVDIPELTDSGLCGRSASYSEMWKDANDEAILGHRNDVYNDAINSAFESYHELLEAGVAPENARMILPIGTQVNMVFSVNARMLMHIADMRAAADAQWEIREMTEHILSLAYDWMPITFALYEKELKGRKNRLAPDGGEVING